MDKYRNDLKANSQVLRNNMTKEERHLWYDFLCGVKPRFHRQKPIQVYVLDFYCPKLRLAIELDGGQHYEEKNISYDAKRTRSLAKAGIRVLRFSNKDINEHFPEVCGSILAAINSFSHCDKGV